MRTYLLLKDKAKQFNADKEVQSLLAEINQQDESMMGYFGKYSTSKANSLKKQLFDRVAIANRGLKYERLDQLTIDIITGTR